MAIGGRSLFGDIGSLFQPKPAMAQQNFTPAPRQSIQTPRQSTQPMQSKVNQTPWIPGITASNQSRLTPTPPVNTNVQTFGGQQTQQPQNNPQPQNNAPQDNSQQYQEQAPQPPQIDFDALIQPALDALSQAESAVNASGEADQTAIESGATTQKSNIGALRTRAETQLASRQATTASAGEQAINESRRAAAELQQGLASRYGASSSTGLGASAIVGAQSARTIGAQRASLTQALNEVETAKTGIVETYNNALKEVDNTTATLKAQARSTLQTNLAQIGQSKAVLQSKKAELVYNAMETYRQEVNAVNQRNTAFKQTLFTQQQDANNKIAQIEAAAKNKIASLPDFQKVTDPLTGQVIQTFNPATGAVGTPTGINTNPNPNDPLQAVGVNSINPTLQRLAEDNNLWE